jgi:hypothetical protein
MGVPDGVGCTVQLWFFSVLPLLLGRNQVRVVLDARRDNEPPNGISAHLIKDALTLAVLVFSQAVIIFCLQCLRVVWPRGFTGERRAIDPSHGMMLIVC